MRTRHDECQSDAPLLVGLFYLWPEAVGMAACEGWPLVLRWFFYVYAAAAIASGTILSMNFGSMNLGVFSLFLVSNLKTFSRERCAIEPDHFSIPSYLL